MKIGRNESRGMKPAETGKPETTFRWVLISNQSLCLCHPATQHVDIFFCLVILKSALSDLSIADGNCFQIPSTWNQTE